MGPSKRIPCQPGCCRPDQRRPDPTNAVSAAAATTQIISSGTPRQPSLRALCRTERRSARVLSDVFITQRDASCRRNRSRLADSSGRSTTGARSLVGAKRGAIVVRHQATWSLLERSIHENYQASRHNQTLRPTLGISYASKVAGGRAPAATPSQGPGCSRCSGSRSSHRPGTHRHADHNPKYGDQ